MRVLILFIILSLGTSCTYLTRKDTKLNRKIDERVKIVVAEARASALITGSQLDKTSSFIESTNFFNAKMSLGLAKEANNLTIGFLDRGQNLVGLPAHDQKETVADLLSSNKITKVIAQNKESVKQAQEENWIEKQSKVEQKLIDYGTKFEEDRNAKIKFWLKWIGIPVVLIGGLIAACVFFPPLVGLLVSIFPKFISIFGVVGKSTAVNVVKGVGAGRDALKAAIERNKALKEAGRTEKTFSPEEVLNMLDTHLKIETNEHDKEIISHLRKVNNV